MRSDAFPEDLSNSPNLDLIRVAPRAEILILGNADASMDFETGDGMNRY